MVYFPFVNTRHILESNSHHWTVWCQSILPPSIHFTSNWEFLLTEPFVILPSGIGFLMFIAFPPTWHNLAVVESIFENEIYEGGVHDISLSKYFVSLL